MSNDNFFWLHVFKSCTCYFVPNIKRIIFTYHYIRIFYFFQEFTNCGSIIEFEDLRKFAVVKQKLIVRAEELLIPSFNIKTRNTPRKDFDKQLDGIAKKIRQKEDQLMKDKAVRVQLDRKKIGISAIRFPVGKFHL